MKRQCEKNVIFFQLKPRHGPLKRAADQSPQSIHTHAGTEDDAAHALKRPRLVWTPPLHKRFVDAVSHLGIKNAVPKTIMQLMNVEGLTRENVASHLQKYRLYLKRLQGCSESTMENSPSREGGGSGGGSGEGSGGSGGGANTGSGGLVMRGGSGGDGSGNEYKREGSGSEGNDTMPGSGQGSGGGGNNDGAAGSDDGSGKGNPALAQSEKGSGAGNNSGGSGNGSGNGSDVGGGQTQTLKAGVATKDGVNQSQKTEPQSQKSEPGHAAAAAVAGAAVNKATQQGVKTFGGHTQQVCPKPNQQNPTQESKPTQQGSGGGEGGGSGGEDGSGGEGGSDDGEERPRSMERASSGDGSNDGNNDDAADERQENAARAKDAAKDAAKTKRTGKSNK